jgi:chemotaxis protein MotB
MADKCKCPECPKCLPGWLAAFGDLMSLLLCFFVLLLSMATMDAVKVREAIGSFKGSFGILPGSEEFEASKKYTVPQERIQKQESVNTAKDSVFTPISEINQVTQSANKEVVTLEESEDGFVVRLPSELLFRPGSANIEYEDGHMFIKRMSMVIQKLPADIEISVRGHSDNQPPNESSLYKDNWEISTARAVSVLRELVENGVNPEKMNASGYGKFKPVASNLTPEGRAKNRRVDLYFYSKNKSEEGMVKKSILD